jgi:hypothetical protein
VQSLVGLALAFSGEAVHEQAQTERLVDDLAKRFPEDTVVLFNYLPTIRAQLALSRNDPSKAFDGLEAGNPYELGLPPSPVFSHAPYPVYVRGKPIWPCIRAAKPRPSFRRFSTIAVLCSMNPSAP